MKTVPFYILDVFSKTKYGGNPLAVFCDLDDSLSSSEMLTIAKEINFAESTFIKKQLNPNTFSVRIFTTESEIPFAGHPTIGTAYILANYLIDSFSKKIILNLKDRNIPVVLSNPDNLDHCLFTMTQSQPEFLQSFSKAAFSKNIGLPESLISDNMPIQEITTGLPFIIIPIKDLESIKQIKPNTKRFISFLIDSNIHISNSPYSLSTSFLFYTNETYEKDSHYNVRMFCIEDGVLKEDAATGSANGCFLAYLLKYNSNSVKVKVEQGFEMKRKSYLFLEGVLEKGNYKITVGGYSKLISKGDWYV